MKRDTDRTPADYADYDLQDYLNDEINVTDDREPNYGPETL